MTRSANPLKAPGWELAGLAALACFYLVGLMFFGDNGSPFLNEVGPLWFALVLGGAAAKAALNARGVLWTGLFWFRVASAIYFGVGSVIEPLLNDYSRGQMLTFFEATPAQVTKFNLIAACCAFTVLATVRLAGAVWPRRLRVIADEHSQRLLLPAGLIFGSIGFATKYLLSVPASLGAFGDVQIPNLIAQMVWLAPVSLFLLTYWSLRRAPQFMPLLAIATLLDSLTGALLFQKAESLLPLLMFMLAVLQHRTTFLRLCLAAAVSVFAFQYLQPAVSYGRTILGERYGSINSGSLRENFGILADYFVEGDDSDAAETQGSLLRIAYMNSAAPAIALYDAGQVGDSLSYVPYVFIPRMLWPDKPIFDMGGKYTALINGTDSSSTWMGFFGEAYWNLGWLGIPVVMIPLGLVFFATGRYAIWVIEQGQWFHFPSVFLAMRMGLRVDGVIASDVVASLVIILVLYPAASFLTAVLQGRRQRPGQARLSRASG